MYHRFMSNKKQRVNKCKSYMQNIKNNWNIKKKAWCSSKRRPRARKSTLNTIILNQIFYFINQEKSSLFSRKHLKIWKGDMWSKHAPWSLQCIRSRFLAWGSKTKGSGLTQSFSWQKWLTSSLPPVNSYRIRPISTTRATRCIPSTLWPPDG